MQSPGPGRYCSENSTIASLARRYVQSTESPIFDAPFWSENGVSCPHERNKIGDSVLWLRQSPKSPNTDLSFFAFKRRFVPACASLNRGFRGLRYVV
jgi:hypothetical protein